MSLLRVGLTPDHVTLTDASATEVFTFAPTTATCTYGDRSIALAEVPVESRRFSDVDLDRRDLGRALGSGRIGLRHVTVRPGGLSSLPHCHSHEEEAFVVIGGGGVLELWDHDELVAEHEVALRQTLLRPPGTGVAHAFRAGPDGLELLAFGTRDPGDMVFYSRSQKVFLRGLGVLFRADRARIEDGEPS